MRHGSLHLLALALLYCQPSNSATAHPRTHSLTLSPQTASSAPYTGSQPACSPSLTRNTQQGLSGCLRASLCARNHPPQSRTRPGKGSTAAVEPNPAPGPSHLSVNPFSSQLATFSDSKARIRPAVQAQSSKLFKYPSRSRGDRLHARTAWFSMGRTGARKRGLGSGLQTPPPRRQHRQAPPHRNRGQAGSSSNGC